MASEFFSKITMGDYQSESDAMSSSSPPNKKRKLDPASTESSTPAPVSTISAVVPAASPSTSASTRNVYLPDEIWKNIIGMCSREDLPSLSAVSKQVHEVTAEILYAEFNGTCKSDDINSGEQDFDHIGLFIRSIAHAPQLAGYIKSATFVQPPQGSKREITMPKMSESARQWMKDHAKKRDFYSLLGDSSRAGQEDVTICMSYVSAVVFLIRLLSPNLKSLSLIGMGGWGSSDDKVTSVLNKISTLQLNRLQIATKGKKDDHLDHDMIQYLSTSSIKTFVGMTKKFPDPVKFKFPALDLSTVEFHDCLDVEGFLKAIRCLQVLKWGGSHASSSLKGLLNFLNEMNFSQCTFKNDLRKLVIDITACQHQWNTNPSTIVALNLSAYKYLKEVTVRSFLALLPGCQTGDEAHTAEGINRFMRNLPTGLQLLHLTGAQPQMCTFLPQLLSHKMQKHRSLATIVISFDFFTPSKLKQPDGMSWDWEKLAMQYSVDVILENEEYYQYDAGSTGAYSKWSKFEGNYLNLQMT